MIVEILVPADDAQHPLRQQFLHGVLDTLRIAVIREAGCKLPKHARAPRQLSQHHQATVRRYSPRIKRALHAAPPFRLKLEPPRVDPVAFRPYTLFRDFRFITALTKDVRPEFPSMVRNPG